MIFFVLLLLAFSAECNYCVDAMSTVLNIVKDKESGEVNISIAAQTGLYRFPVANATIFVKYGNKTNERRCRLITDENGVASFQPEDWAVYLYALFPCSNIEECCGEEETMKEFNFSTCWEAVENLPACPNAYPISPSLSEYPNKSMVLINDSYYYFLLMPASNEFALKKVSGYRESSYALCFPFFVIIALAIAAIYSLGMPLRLITPTLIRKKKMPMMRPGRAAGYTIMPAQMLTTTSMALKKAGRALSAYGAGKAGRILQRAGAFVGGEWIGKGLGKLVGKIKFVKKAVAGIGKLRMSISKKWIAIKKEGGKAPGRVGIGGMQLEPSQIGKMMWTETPLGRLLGRFNLSFISALKDLVAKIKLILVAKKFKEGKLSKEELENLAKELGISEKDLQDLLKSGEIPTIGRATFEFFKEIFTGVFDPNNPIGYRQSLFGMVFYRMFWFLQDVFGGMFEELKFSVSEEMRKLQKNAEKTRKILEQFNKDESLQNVRKKLNSKLEKLQAKLRNATPERAQQIMADIAKVKEQLSAINVAIAIAGENATVENAISEIKNIENQIASIFQRAQSIKLELRRKLKEAKGEKREEIKRDLSNPDTLFERVLEESLQPTILREFLKTTKGKKTTLAEVLSGTKNEVVREAMEWALSKGILSKEMTVEQALESLDTLLHRAATVDFTTLTRAALAFGENGLFTWLVNFGARFSISSVDQPVVKFFKLKQLFGNEIEEGEKVENINSMISWLIKKGYVTQSGEVLTLNVEKLKELSKEQQTFLIALIQFAKVEPSGKPPARFDFEKVTKELRRSETIKSIAGRKDTQEERIKAEMKAAIEAANRPLPKQLKVTMFLSFSEDQIPSSSFYNAVLAAASYAKIGTSPQIVISGEKFAVGKLEELASKTSISVEGKLAWQFVRDLTRVATGTDKPENYKLLIVENRAYVVEKGAITGDLSEKQLEQLSVVSFAFDQKDNQVIISDINFHKMAGLPEYTYTLSREGMKMLATAYGTQEFLNNNVLSQETLKEKAQKAFEETAYYQLGLATLTGNSDFAYSSLRALVAMKSTNSLPSIARIASSTLEMSRYGSVESMLYSGPEDYRTFAEAGAATHGWLPETQLGPKTVEEIVSEPGLSKELFLSNTLTQISSKSDERNDERNQISPYVVASVLSTGYYQPHLFLTDYMDKSLERIYGREHPLTKAWKKWKESKISGLTHAEVLAVLGKTLSGKRGLQLLGKTATDLAKLVSSSALPTPPGEKKRSFSPSRKQG